MSFKVKRIISLILAVLPVVYLVLCIFMTDFIIEHDHGDFHLTGSSLVVDLLTGKMSEMSSAGHTDLFDPPFQGLSLLPSAI